MGFKKNIYMIGFWYIGRGRFLMFLNVLFKKYTLYSKLKTCERKLIATTTQKIKCSYGSSSSEVHISKSDSKIQCFIFDQSVYIV